MRAGCHHVPLGSPRLRLPAGIRLHVIHLHLIRIRQRERHPVKHQALSSLGSVVQDGFRSAIGFITSLPGRALQWGMDFINGISHEIPQPRQQDRNMVHQPLHRRTHNLPDAGPDRGSRLLNIRWTGMIENPVLAGIVDMIRSLWENLSAAPTPWTPPDFSARSRPKPPQKTPQTTDFP